MAQIEEGIYCIKGNPDRSIKEAQEAGDVTRIAHGLTIKEYGLKQVVYVMEGNSTALKISKVTDSYICWYDGYRQWSLKDMQKRLEDTQS
ncbi:hypothetical protein CF126_03395 [Aeromonas dhakensis]|uniref:hypothetical protein n=1 Tax=Aeromonas TaxID=642 RepID=UPI00111AD9C4|nr:hypothetical protein [Aeromonas dhakensis]TNI58896.1 hypothetical protein CF126_03395 [Aeromonas dhakensis]